MVEGEDLAGMHLVSQIDKARISKHDRDVAIFSQQFLNGARLVRKTHRRLKGSPSSSEIAQMFVVTAKVMDAGRELAEANYSLGSLLGWQLCVSQRTYAITCNIRIAPTMTEL